MAAVLVLLLAALARRHEGYLVAAMIVHVVNMVWSQIFRPVAVLWFALSHALGTIASKVLMTVVFFVVVTPLAVWRRRSGVDAMQLRVFKSGRESVMQQRNHTFTGEDIEQPF